MSHGRPRSRERVHAIVTTSSWFRRLRRRGRSQVWRSPSRGPARALRVVAVSSVTAEELERVHPRVVAPALRVFHPHAQPTDLLAKAAERPVRPAPPSCRSGHPGPRRTRQLPYFESRSQLARRADRADSRSRPGDGATASATAETLSRPRSSDGAAPEPRGLASVKLSLARGDAPCSERERCRVLCGTSSRSCSSSRSRDRPRPAVRRRLAPCAGWPG